MSERQARTRRRTTAGRNGKPKNGPATVPEGTETPEEHDARVAAETAARESEPIKFPGVFVYRVPGANPGDEKIELAPVNGLDPFAVPSLLRFAANYQESLLGINKGGR